MIHPFPTGVLPILLGLVLLGGLPGCAMEQRPEFPVTANQAQSLDQILNELSEELAAYRLTHDTIDRVTVSSRVDSRDLEVKAILDADQWLSYQSDEKQWWVRSLLKAYRKYPPRSQPGVGPRSSGEMEPPSSL